MLLLLKTKDKYLYLSLALINIPSNLMANLIQSLTIQVVGVSNSNNVGFYIVILVIEALVVILEYKVLSWIFSSRYSRRRIFLISLFVNVFSFLVGVVLLGV